MKKKRILCSLLTLAMLMALLTVTAFAEGEEALTLPTGGGTLASGTYQLTGDVTLTGPGNLVVAGRDTNVVIDLNGYKLDVSAITNYGISVKDGATCTICDSSDAGRGTVKLGNYGFFNKLATLNITGGTMSATKCVVRNNRGAYLNISSAALETDGGPTVYNEGSMSVDNGATITSKTHIGVYSLDRTQTDIQDSTISGQGIGIVALSGGNVKVYGDSEVTGGQTGIDVRASSSSDSAVIEVYGNSKVAGGTHSGIYIGSENTSIRIYGDSEVTGGQYGIIPSYAITQKKPVIDIADKASVYGTIFGIYTGGDPYDRDSHISPADISVSDDAVVCSSSEVSGSTGISLWGRCVLHVSGGTIQGFTGLTSNGTNESYCDSRGSQCYISGGQIIGFQKSVGIYWPSSDYSEDIPSILEITGGTVSGGSGIFFCGGTLKVSGGEIIGTLNKMQPGDGYDGYEYVQKKYSNPANSGSFNATGAALIVPVNRVCKADTDPYQVYVVKKVEITGGTFISDGEEPAVACVNMVTANDRPNSYAPTNISITGGYFWGPEEEYAATNVFGETVKVVAVQIYEKTEEGYKPVEAISGGYFSTDVQHFYAPDGTDDINHEYAGVSFVEDGYYCVPNFAEDTRDPYDFMIGTGVRYYENKTDTEPIRIETFYIDETATLTNDLISDGEGNVATGWYYKGNDALARNPLDGSQINHAFYDVYPQWTPSFLLGGGVSTSVLRPILNKDDHVAYIIGYEDGTVRPNNSITRAEVATIFFRLLTDDTRAHYWSQTNSYSDVHSGDWFNNAVSTMSAAGIITGYPDGTFRPNAPITRAEFAAIVARFSDQSAEYLGTFSDVSYTHWASGSIALAAKFGWVTGYEDNTFKPDQSITRAEAMTITNRILERAVEEDHMLPDMVTWTDNRPDAWYYEVVQEATNSHTYARVAKLVPDQSYCYEEWLKIEANPDWAALEKIWSRANSR